MFSSTGIGLYTCTSGKYEYQYQYKTRPPSTKYYISV